MNHEEIIEDLMKEPESPRERAAVTEIIRMRAALFYESSKNGARWQIHHEWSTSVTILGSLGLVLWFILNLKPLVA
jgi:hypothetical protein